MRPEPAHSGEVETAAPPPAVAAAPAPVDGAALVQAAERAVARLMRRGVLLSAALLVAGFIGAGIAGEPLRGAALPLPALLRGEAGPWALLAQLGLLVLAATPLLRVALAAGVFARLGERRTSLAALAVLGFLAASLFLGGEV